MFDVIEIDPTKEIDYIEYYPSVDGVICPVANDPYHAEFRIAFHPNHKVMEYISFEDWLSALVEDTPRSIEDYCRAVFDGIDEVLNPGFLEVTLVADSGTHARVKATAKKYTLPRRQ